MAKVESIKGSVDELRRVFAKSLQSGNINFLIGSGASSCAINISGNIEIELEKLLREGKVEDAERKIHSFLTGLQNSTNVLLKFEELSIIDSNLSDETKKALKDIEKTIKQYTNFLEAVESILNERKNNLLPKRANVFTTNYDLFFEKSAEKFLVLRLNDGFQRTANLRSRHCFASQNFFSSIFNTGNLYSYKAEIPTINLIKLHGSLSWLRDDGQITFSVSAREPLPDTAPLDQIEAHNQSYSLVLPRKQKFNETTMDRTYYDLLRIFANELEREHTLLISYGFSFEDEHIRDIVFRSLKNPTLKLIIVSYSVKGSERALKFFEGFNNVLVVAPDAGGQNSFDSFSELLMNALPQPVKVSNVL